MTVADLSDRLLDAADPSGGWSYYAGRAPRIESTCWALLALDGTTSPADFDPGPHLAFLRSLEQPTGDFVDVGGQVNYAWNALSALTLGTTGGADDRAMAGRLTAMLLERRGIAIEGETPEVRLDGSLQAWSWVDGTFSWVEPTALALLALRQTAATGETAAARIDEAERLLADRACPGGGWNYGNGAVMGQDLRPYVPTTALALLALQTGPDRPFVREGLRWLQEHATSEPSAMALSLAAIALHAYNEPVGPLVDALAQQFEHTGFLDNLHLTAMALYAATLETHAARAFQVAT